MLVGGEQGHDAAVIQGVAAPAGGLGGPFQRPDQALRVGLDQAQGGVDQRQEVPLHPGDGPELGPVGHLVEGDPEPEVAGAEAVALLQHQDVRPDVVDGVGVPTGLVGDQQVVLAEHPLGQEAHEDAHLGAGHRPAGGGQGALGHPFADPAGERLQGVAEAAEVGVDPGLAVEDERPGRAARGDQPGVLADQLLGPGRDGVEVGPEGGGQVGLLERVMAGHAAGQPLGHPPVDRFRGGALGAQVDFLPTFTPCFSITTRTMYPTTIISSSPRKLAASTKEIQ